MGIVDKAKQAAGTIAGVAVLVNVTHNDVHHEVDKVTLAGIPLFKRDAEGNPSILGIRFRRRKAPRG
jgi:hypothetical protein